MDVKTENWTRSEFFNDGQKFRRQSVNEIDSRCVKSYLFFLRAKMSDSFCNDPYSFMLMYGQM